MILKKILLAFEPPGLGLVYYEHSKEIIKHISLINLNETTNIYDLTEQIIENESNEIQCHKNIIHNAILKIQEKLKQHNKFHQNQNVLEHLLPVTNIAIDNSGEKCVTGNYDHTAKIWDLNTGKQINSLKGHNSVVFSVNFNAIGDNILTGSFDKTARLWNTLTGQTLQTFWGHTDEITDAQFLPNEEIAATTSTDTTLRLFQIETGQEIKICVGHNDDIVCLQIDKFGKFISSGSFDKTIRIWDASSGNCVHVLCGHEAEISSCKINDEGTLLVSGSFDGRIIVWDLRKMKYCKIFPTHTTETQKILDVDLKNELVAGCTSEKHAYIFNLKDDNNIVLSGHQKAISKICFNPTNDSEVVTCSEDHTLRVWNIEKALIRSQFMQHPDKVFTCVYSKCGKKIISACKDNTCRVWIQK